MFLLIEKWESLTHGPVGIMGIPAPTGIGPLQFGTPLSQYYLVLAFLALGLWVMARIVRSLLGRSFMAIRNSDELAEALGIDLMRTKTLSFVLSVFYAGFAGALYAGQVRFLGPDLASEERDLRPDHVRAGGRHRHAAGTAAGHLPGAVADAEPAVPAGLPLGGVRAAADRADDLPARRHRGHLAEAARAPRRRAARGRRTPADPSATAEGEPPCLRSTT
jgi:hypothetical protein